MPRLLILMGALTALLSACGPPDPGLMADETADAEMSNARGAENTDDMNEVPAGF